MQHRRARRYILRLLKDGTARVTLPRWGTLAEAARFAQANIHWLERQLVKQASAKQQDTRWQAGTMIYLRGQTVPLEVHPGELRFGTESCAVGDLPEQTDLKPYVQRHLWSLAVRELPERVKELAGANGLGIRRVTVRNQRSRWGSCSRRGTISLNWRLVQAPDFVRDYIILHEMAHLREMNHSRRFWAVVKRLCPDFSTAERWLKQHSKLLLR